MTTDQVALDEREKFIYGRIDVEILDHEKTFEAGEGAFGVYVAAILYCRKKLNDGFMSKAAALALLGGAGARHYAKLTEVGWFIELADGRVEVWNYAKKNDTRAQVEAARSAVRSRMKKHREGKRVTDAPCASDVTRDIERTDGVRADDVPSSSSLSVSESGISFSDARGGGDDAAPSESVSRVRARPELEPDAVFEMPEDLPLTGEARAAAEIAGVLNVDDEWAKFRARQIRDGTRSTLRGWYAGAWTKWFIDAKRYQSVERTREARASPSNRAVQPVPATGRVWKVGKS